MGYEYIDEQTSTPNHLPKDEITKIIKDMQLKKYGRTYPLMANHTHLRDTIYSVEKKALVYRDTKEKIAL